MFNSIKYCLKYLIDHGTAHDRGSFIDEAHTHQFYSFVFQWSQLIIRKHYIGRGWLGHLRDENRNTTITNGGEVSVAAKFYRFYSPIINVLISTYSRETRTVYISIQYPHSRSCSLKGVR